MPNLWVFLFPILGVALPGCMMTDSPGADARDNVSRAEIEKFQTFEYSPKKESKGGASPAPTEEQRLELGGAAGDPCEGSAFLTGRLRWEGKVAFLPNGLGKDPSKATEIGPRIPVDQQAVFCSKARRPDGGAMLSGTIQVHGQSFPIDSAKSVIPPRSSDGTYDVTVASRGRTNREGILDAFPVVRDMGADKFLNPGETYQFVATINAKRLQPDTVDSGQANVEVKLGGRLLDAYFKTGSIGGNVVIKDFRLQNKLSDVAGADPARSSSGAGAGSGRAVPPSAPPSGDETSPEQPPAPVVRARTAPLPKPPRVLEPPLAPWVFGKPPGDHQFTPRVAISWTALRRQCVGADMAYFPVYSLILPSTTPETRAKFLKYHPEEVLERTLEALGAGQPYYIYATVCMPRPGTKGTVIGATCSTDGNPERCSTPAEKVSTNENVWDPFVYLSVTPHRSPVSGDHSTFTVVGTVHKYVPGDMLPNDLEWLMIPHALGDIVRKHKNKLFNQSITISGNILIHPGSTGTPDIGYSGALQIQYPNENESWAFELAGKHRPDLLENQVHEVAQFFPAGDASMALRP